MADWIACKSVGHADGTVFVNMDKVDCIVPHTKGSMIVFSGMDDDNLIVSERPEDVIVKLKVRGNA